MRLKGRLSSLIQGVFNKNIQLIVRINCDLSGKKVKWDCKIVEIFLR